jgi:hypothetical protein
VNRRLAYVAVSRGRYDAQVYTNDKGQLANQLSRDVSHRTAMEPSRTFACAVKVRLAVNAHHRRARSSLHPHEARARAYADRRPEHQQIESRFPPLSPRQGARQLRSSLLSLLTALSLRDGTTMRGMGGPRSATRLAVV